MAVLKFSRDRRGYEHVYLVQATNRRGKIRSRVLYWFRTPPGVKVGREPFDEAVRRALEAQNPDVSFDWPKLIETPIPPPAPDIERWRERRRVERAARQQVEARASDAESDDRATAEDEREQPEVEAVPPESAIAAGAAPVESTNAAPARRRRRRRRRRPSTLHQAQGRPEHSRGTTGSGRGEPVEPRRPTTSGMPGTSGFSANERQDDDNEDDPSDV